MTAQEAIKQVLDLARSEIGYHEKASYAQLNDKTANSGGSVLCPNIGARFLTALSEAHSYNRQLNLERTTKF